MGLLYQYSDPPLSSCSGTAPLALLRGVSDTEGTRNASVYGGHLRRDLTLRIPTLIVVGVLCGSDPARLQAEPITLTTTGMLSSVCPGCVHDKLGLSAKPGGPFIYSLTFDSDPLSHREIFGLSTYQFGAGTLSVSFGGDAVTMPVPHVTASIRNNVDFDHMSIQTALVGRHPRRSDLFCGGGPRHDGGMAEYCRVAVRGCCPSGRGPRDEVLY
jgi:hypothetical protein